MAKLNRRAAAERDQIGQNIAAVTEFHARQMRELGASQRLTEHLADAVGHPAALGVILGFVALWVGVNVWLSMAGPGEFDPAPYHWLQGLLALSALLVTAVVLSKQNRMDRVAEQRAHLDLKVTLLIEQKVAKIIGLLEDLRRDTPDVPDRHDAHASALQEAMSPVQVLAALDEAVPASDLAAATPGTPAAKSTPPAPR